MGNPLSAAASSSPSHHDRHHHRHHRPRAAAGTASFLALLACCSTALPLALGFVVTQRAPLSRIHVLSGGGHRIAPSSSSSRTTMMMTADGLQDQNLPRSPSSSPPRSTLPAVLGGMSLPFLARTIQAALAAPGAGRIAGRATDIPPPPPPSNSRIERSYTPRSSSSLSSFEFSRSIPKIRIQNGDLMSNDRVVLHGRPVQKTDVAVFGGFVGAALAQAEFAKRKERGGGTGGVEGDVFLVTYQVALYDRDQHGLMRALQRLAQRAETTTSSGLASLASSVSLELLRSYEGWVASTAQSGRFKDMAAAERAFNEASMKERKKWGFENSVEDRAAAALAARQQQQRGGRGKGKENEVAAAMAGKQLIVLTLMVACRNIGGKNILPRKQGSAEALENSLERFAAALLEKNGKNVLAVDVSWTPDGEGETLSRKDVTLKWPELLDL